MKKYLLPSIAVLALSSAMGFLASCENVGAEYREVTAERIARPAFMVERYLDAGGMRFKLWERTYERGEPANLYIEGGDEDATYLSRIITQDSTPNNPVALHLASRDHADNLIYISRPCQFRESVGADKDMECDPALWSNRRFSPEVMEAYQQALNEIKARWNITEFNLIGYDGGANIAAGLAATRSDIASLRTVAGNLSPDMAFAKKETKLDADNIRANAIAPSLAKIPQHHFVGAGDEDVPPAIYHSFRQQMGESDCVHYTMVQDADHTRGWVEKWPELLNSSVTCQSESMVDPNHVPVALPPIPEDIDHGQK